MSDMNGVVGLLEEAREELGGLGEPAWSGAILAVRQLEAERDRLLKAVEDQAEIINKRNIHVREQKKVITELKGRVTVLTSYGPTSLSEELMRAFGDGG